MVRKNTKLTIFTVTESTNGHKTTPTTKKKNPHSGCETRGPKMAREAAALAA